MISIEINPNSYYYLCENIKLNNCDNITPVLGDCLVETPNYKSLRKSLRTLLDLLSHEKSDLCPEGDLESERVGSCLLSKYL